MSPDGIPMLNMAKPITPAPETLALKMEEMVKAGRTPQSSMKRFDPELRKYKSVQFHLRRSGSFCDSGKSKGVFEK